MFYDALHRVVPPLLRAVWRPEVHGIDNVPRRGGVILASNHLSFVDSVVIPAVAPRKVVFLAKSEYFTAPGLWGAVQRTWFEALGILPVDRDDTKSAVESLDVALDVLRGGDAFGIYPEGTRSRDGRLYRGRTGAAHLALIAGVPIVPVGLRGTERIQPIGARLPRLVKVHVTFGEPIDPRGRYDDLALGKARRMLTDEVMTAIQRLTGQEEAGVYNERPVEA